MKNYYSTNYFNITYQNFLVISTTAKLSHKDEVNNNFAMIDLGWSKY